MQNRLEGCQEWRGEWQGEDSHQLLCLSCDKIANVTPTLVLARQTWVMLSLLSNKETISLSVTEAHDMLAASAPS